MSEKIFKIFLIILAIALFIFGQILIIFPNNYVMGAVFSLLSFFILFIAINDTYKKLKEPFFKIGDLIKNLISTVKISELNKIKEEKFAFEKKEKIIKEKQDIIKQTPVKQTEKKIEQEKLVSDKLFIKILISKKLLFIFAIVVFFLAQFFLFNQKLLYTVILIVLDIFVFLKALLMKEEKLDLSFNLEKGIKLLSIFIGIIFIIIGWVLLINIRQSIQNIGVVFTTIGILLAYFGLPENEMGSAYSEAESDILFINYKFLDNPFVKIALLIFAFIMLKIGEKVMHDPNANMYCFIFYALAIAAFFFSLPWINFHERFYDNKFLNIFKLLLICFALYIAYKGQIDFTQHRVNEAIIKYLIAGAIFIITFPIYSIKEQEYKIPLYLEILYLVIIMLVGFYLRVYELNIRPFGLENDEAGGMVSVVKNFWVGQHPIYAYVSELSYKIFGYNRIGLRAQGVMMGMIAIPAMYFALRSVFNVRIAMVVTIIFTFLRWNLHYSRSGHGTILMIVAETLAIYFILKAIQKRDKLTYFMAGLTTGLCWYGLLTGWLVIIMPVAYFAAKELTSKDFLKKNMIGIIVFSLGFWVFASQHIHNFFISKNIYFKRIGEVSVFGQVGLERQSNPAIGIVENTKNVLLMFNHIGDNRQRNSGGQPYEPTIDFVSSMFFAIGFIYSIYYSRYYLFFILIMLFFSQASGSIFSIEAPSAMRAIGTMIPVIFFIAITVDKIWIAIRRVVGMKLEKIVFPILIAIPLFFIVRDNYNQYFKRWVGGFDELATAAGMYSEKLGKSYRIYLYTSLYYPGHPPYRVYRWDYKVNCSANISDGIVNLSLIDDENYAIFFHPDTWDGESYWKNLIPGVQFDSMSHEAFGKFIDVALIKNEYIKKVRGLKGTYYYSDKTKEIIENDLPNFDIKKSGKIPYKVIWEGVILIPYYCLSVFRNEGNTEPEIYIDKNKILFNKNYKLAKGFHNIKIIANRNNINDILRISLYCTKDGVRGYTANTEKIELNEKYLYSVKNVGLHAYYYGSEFVEQTPIINEEIVGQVYYTGRVIADAPSFKLSGFINILEDGLYRFIAKNNGYVRIVIGNSYMESGSSPLLVSGKFNLPGKNSVNAFTLKKGRYKIDIYSINSSFFQLKWASAGKGEEDIPFDILEPDLKIE